MRSSKAFTLIELMIVIVVIGILAAIAYPNYTEHVRRGKRAEVKAALMEGAQALERYYSTHGSYLDAEGNFADSFASQTPASGAANYTIAAQGAPTATTYQLRATRTGSMANDPCGDFQISQTGERTLANATRTAAQCW
ncbi:type IV pilin protein [Metapseudomonas resinovorans]|uniref:type IV pilin protein n=1 Tax=Metapseudomonas resinovorans TaxID=53412 RepID=UPI00040A9CDA|nr:type IV pilin protein [Pseudomonas resinovorans]MDE3738361.1 type IV pilin protein [Pseudomonas resinovorans]